MRALIFSIFFLGPFAARASSLFCQGWFDPGAGYTVTAELNDAGEIQGLLHMDYADNDGFSFKHEVTAEPVALKAGKNFEIRGKMREGTMSLVGTWNESSGKFDSVLSAQGSLGEGFDLDTICEIR